MQFNHLEHVALGARACSSITSGMRDKVNGACIAIHLDRCYNVVDVEINRQHKYITNNNRMQHNSNMARLEH